MISFEREPFDLDAYEKRIYTGPCFICEMVHGNHEAGNPKNNDIVYRDSQAIVFLNKYPTLYGYTLVAPIEHREQVTGDFTAEQYLDLHRMIYRVAEAVRLETNAERVYILSLGSQQGNKHVHWHIAPLPAGVPFQQQQLAALSVRNGILKIPAEEMQALSKRLRVRIEASYQPYIRTIALAIIRQDEKILVFEASDPTKPGVFYRPLGGGVNPGEYGKDAIVREMREEIGAELQNVQYLGTIENHFIYNGKRGHEIVLMFQADLVDESLYHQLLIQGKEDNGDPLQVKWMPLEYFRQAEAAPLYPDGLLQFLTR